MANAHEVVAAYWAVAEARDWDAFGGLLADDVVYRVPQTRTGPWPGCLHHAHGVRARQSGERAMIDVTSKLESFIAGKAGWQLEQGKELALAIAHQLHESLDWDEDAGEDWARVLADDKVTALVCMTGPLVIIVGDAAADALEATGDLGKAVAVIKVPDINAVVLRCAADILSVAFGDLATPALDPNAFSASDLWFSTV